MLVTTHWAIADDVFVPASLCLLLLYCNATTLQQGLHGKCCMALIYVLNLVKH
jgi:hypothetical protein